MDLLEMAVENADDGDNNEYRYVPGRSTAGFLHFNGTYFFCLHPHVNQWRGRIFFPYEYCAKILGSSMGIVLSLPYVVNNPLIKGSAVRLPIPTATHTDPVDPHALVAYVDDNLGLVFYIVCAFSVGHHQYKFNAYSSYTTEWRYGQIPENLGDIMVDTGMSCGRRAYWLTKRPLAAVVYYDVSDFSHGFLDVPERFQVDPCPCQLQLGSWGGNQLILLASMATQMEVYTLTQGQQQWELSFHQEFQNRRPPIPLRSQSRMLQAVFWVDNRMLIWEKGCNEENRMGQPQPPRMRLMPFRVMQPDTIVTGFLATLVPHIETTLRPLDFYLSGRRRGFRRH